MASARNTSAAAAGSPRRRITKSPTTASVVIPDHLIAEEAYLLFLARQGRDGDAIGDWLAAERIVRDRLMPSPVPALRSRRRASASA